MKNKEKMKQNLIEFIKNPDLLNDEIGERILDLILTDLCNLDLNIEGYYLTNNNIKYLRNLIGVYNDGEFQDRTELSKKLGILETTCKAKEYEIKSKILQYIKEERIVLKSVDEGEEKIDILCLPDRVKSILYFKLKIKTISKLTSYTIDQLRSEMIIKIKLEESEWEEVKRILVEEVHKNGYKFLDERIRDKEVPVDDTLDLRILSSALNFPQRSYYLLNHYLKCETLGDLLNVDITKKTNKKLSTILPEIIEKIHNFGLKFKCEYRNQEDLDSVLIDLADAYKKRRELYDQIKMIDNQISLFEQRMLELAVKKYNMTDEDNNAKKI